MKRDGRVLGTARVIGLDRDRDLALLMTDKRISGYTFGFASGAPRLGEDVGAIGFPLGLPLTVTQGSVSGFDRVTPIDGVKRRHLVQTDAAVNPGNSGGPLLSRESGQVVGLVDLGSNVANGIAFAVSGRTAAPLFRAWAAAPQAPAQDACGQSNNSPGNVSASGAASPADYADAVDTALIDSARTRKGLGDLIDAVNSGSLDQGSADDAMNAVIDQRRQLLSDVQGVDPPSAFARPAALLKASLVTALSDDLAVQDWATRSIAATRQLLTRLGRGTSASAHRQLKRRHGSSPNKTQSGSGFCILRRLMSPISGESQGAAGLPHE